VIAPQSALNDRIDRRFLFQSAEDFQQSEPAEKYWDQPEQRLPVPGKVQTTQSVFRAAATNLNPRQKEADQANESGTQIDTSQCFHLN